MTKKKIKLELISGPGFLVKENVIPVDVIDLLSQRLHELKPKKISSHNVKYFENEKINEAPDTSIWWSQQLDWDEVLKIDQYIHPLVNQHLDNSQLYSSNIITVEPYTNWVNPQVDMPHRFETYNFDKRFLGLQVAIPLVDTDILGVFPKSQVVNFDIGLCYKGYYTHWFKANCVRPKLKKGSIIFYNTRLLHSSMPNNSNQAIPLLLMNYLDNDIINNVKNIDPTWDH